MGKLGGLAILVAAAVSLSACAGAVETTGSTSPEPSSTSSAKIAPLFAAPADTSATATPTPTPTATMPPEFYDDSARAKYLAGVKQALNAWRDGVIPSDEVLIQGAEQACGLLAQGKTWSDIGEMAGESTIARDNASAVAIYASRFLCTKYNTDR